MTTIGMILARTRRRRQPSSVMIRISGMERIEREIWHDGTVHNVHHERQFWNTTTQKETYKPITLKITVE